MVKSWVSSAALLLIVGQLVVGCDLARLDPPAPLPPPPKPAVVAPAPPLPPPPKPKPDAPPVRTQTKERSSPDELTDLDEAAIQTLLGAAQTVRTQTTAKVLVYAIPTCRIEILLFQDMSDGQWHAASWEIVPQGAKGLTGDICYTAIKEAKK